MAGKDGITASDEIPAVRNALLYSDSVIWIPGRVFSDDLKNAVRAYVLGLRATHGPPSALAELEEALEAVLASDGLDDGPVCEAFWEELESTGLADLIAYRWRPGTWAASLKIGGPEIGGGIVDAIKKGLDTSHCCIRVGAISSGLSSAAWDPYKATQIFTDAISRLLLPDVSGLPLPVLAELRERLASTLDPMRAELLRLTVDLRASAGQGASDQDFERAAEVLIKTRVEPVVREAGQRAREIMEAKWRRFYKGVAKVFGLTGAAFFRPDLLKDAFREALDTGGALANREGNSKEQLADTARFVLEARRYVIERGRPQRIQNT
jgi:hypothetical protein